MAEATLQKPTKLFKWTPAKRRAAILVAEDELIDEEIARSCGVTRPTLHHWRQHEDFCAEVGGHVGRIQAGMLRLAIAKKHKRLSVLEDIHAKALRIIDARAVEMAGAAPGSETGLLVRQVKQVGSGRDAEIVEEFVVDVGLIKEVRALHEQAAKELGQWEDRLAIDQTTVVQLVGIDAEVV